jgi:hypothetical protein
MDEISKLHHLLSHWAEHNIEHAKTYEIGQKGWGPREKNWPGF